MAKVHGIDIAARTLETATERIPYDRLVLALESEPNDFEVTGAADNAFFLRWMDDAVPLRQHILACLEVAMDEPDPEHRRRLLTFVIVGESPTGVEFASALAELVHGPAMWDYSGIQRGESHIVLVGMTERVLLSMSKRLSVYAADRLARRRVEVHTGATVESNSRSACCSRMTRRSPPIP
jgi:NADH dehydrogenase